ncbi:MAG TPA: helical backbone metal receptor [Kineosporiaceae bacterium]|nr:helical backbone metal receptor [Kineosporiaceae bacterium]
MRDDLGHEVAVPKSVHRVVSIVPSLTEAIAATAPGLLVGATDWCTHPADLEVPRIRGTKNPDVAAIVALAPDVVVANEEENREVDLQQMRDAGLAVWVSRIRTVPEAFDALRRMLTLACRCESPDWLARAEAAWAEVPPGLDRGTAVIPIWRRPWMVVGRDTFTGDVLRRLGVRNAFETHSERYPKVPLEQVRAVRPDLVVLPDEPYRFTADDGPEAFAGIPSALVSGRYLTWYGPSLERAAEVLTGQLDPSAWITVAKQS